MSGSMEDSANYSAQVAIPASDDRPIIVTFPDRPAVEFAVIGRKGLAQLGSDWDVPMVYLLLGVVDPTGHWSVHVGQRINQPRSHVVATMLNEDFWIRAILIRSRSRPAFDPVRVSWLQRHIYDELATTSHAVLRNPSRPDDDPLPNEDRILLEGYIPLTIAVLRLVGYGSSLSPGETPDSPGETPEDSNGSPAPFSQNQPGPRSPLDNGETESTGQTPRNPVLPPPHHQSQHTDIEILHLMSRGKLTPGVILYTHSPTWPARASLTEAGAFEVAGNTYPSPTAAARAVTGGSWNGWMFWGIFRSGIYVTLQQLQQEMVPDCKCHTCQQSRR